MAPRAAAELPFKELPQALSGEYKGYSLSNLNSVEQRDHYRFASTSSLCLSKMFNYKSI